MKYAGNINHILTVLFLTELVTSSFSYDRHEISEMKSGKIIRKKIEVEKKVQVLTAGIIVSDIHTIRRVLVECEKHREFIPRSQSCQVLFFELDSIYNQVIINPPLGKEITFYLNTRLFYSDSVTIITMKMDRTKPAPYISDIHSFWKVTSLDSTTHVLAYYLDIDFKFHWTYNWLLRPLIESMFKKDLPGLIENYRARIESGETWKIGQPKPVPKIILKTEIPR